jgi:hypothetical protein
MRNVTVPSSRRSPSRGPHRGRHGQLSFQRAIVFNVATTCTRFPDPRSRASRPEGYLTASSKMVRAFQIAGVATLPDLQMPPPPSADTHTPFVGPAQAMAGQATLRLQPA